MLEESIFSTRIEDAGDKENHANLTTDLEEQSHFPLQLVNKESTESRSSASVQTALAESKVLCFRNRNSSLKLVRENSGINSASSNDSLAPLQTKQKFTERIMPGTSTAPSLSFDENPSKYVRKIATQPYRVLDAPHLCDDFYLNLVDWS